MLITDPTLGSTTELYDIQMLENLDIPKGKELFCTNSDLEQEEIDSMNACARALGLIQCDDFLTNIQIRGINVEEKWLLGFVADSAQNENSNQENPETRKNVAFYIKEGLQESLSELKDFTLTRQGFNGKNHTDWLSTGIVDNPIESAYLLLLHKILLSHGVLRDNPEFIIQMEMNEKALKERKIQEDEDGEQEQLEEDLKNFEDYVISNGSIHIEKEGKVIVAEGNKNKFTIKCTQDGIVMFEFLHESLWNDEGEKTINSYTIKFNGRELWNPKSMIKISKYSKEIFGDALELIKERITQ